MIHRRDGFNSLSSASYHNRKRRWWEAILFWYWNRTKMLIFLLYWELYLLRLNRILFPCFSLNLFYVLIYAHICMKQLNRTTYHSKRWHVRINNNNNFIYYHQGRRDGRRRLVWWRTWSRKRPGLRWRVPRPARVSWFRPKPGGLDFFVIMIGGVVY